MRELGELRTTVKHQGSLIEKQGALLLGHAQLLHEMREEMVSLRGSGGAGHERQLKDLTTSTLKTLTSSIETLQKDAVRLERNTQALANYQGVSLDSVAISLDDSMNATAITKKDETFGIDLTLGSLDLPETSAHPIVQMSEFQPYDEPQPHIEQAAHSTPLHSSRRTDSPRFSRPSVPGMNNGCGGAIQDAGGRDLYSRGMAQKKKRESEIANRKKVEEEHDKKLMRKPEISTLAKRSKSSDKPLAMRTDEWRAKREKRRENLRTEMQKIEEDSLQPTPHLNPRSVKIAHAAEEKKKSVTQDTGPVNSFGGYGAMPLGTISPKSPAPNTTPISMIASPADSSPPPLDELLERLRKRRYVISILCLLIEYYKPIKIIINSEMLGLTSSDSPM